MKIIQYLINGISIGSVYAIIALGYTMVYGIAKIYRLVDEEETGCCQVAELTGSLITPFIP